MKISIKSEADSRMLVYPLLKVLKDYGTVCLFTGAPWADRLIDDELNGGFRNIRVIHVYDGDLQFAMEQDGTTDTKYDFIIFDNVGAQQYDVLFGIITNFITYDYISDLTNIIDEPATHIIKFGTPGKKPAEKKGSKKQEVDVEAEQLEETKKWATELSAEDLFIEALTDRKTKWCKMPAMEDIESLESKHIFYVPSDDVLKEIYRIIPQAFNVEERNFIKGGRSKDEGSININGKPVW